MSTHNIPPYGRTNAQQQMSTQNSLENLQRYGGTNVQQQQMRQNTTQIGINNNNTQYQLTSQQQTMQNTAQIGINNIQNQYHLSQPKVPTMAITSNSGSTANNTATHPNASASTTQSTTNVQQQMMQNTTQININKNTQSQDPQQSNQQQRALCAFTPLSVTFIDGISESMHDTLLENKPYYYGSMNNRGEADFLLKDKPPNTFLFRLCTDPNERVNGDLNRNLFIFSHVATPKPLHIKIWRYTREGGLGQKRDPSQTTVFKYISQLVHSLVGSKARPISEYLPVPVEMVEVRRHTHLLPSTHNDTDEVEICVMYNAMDNQKTCKCPDKPFIAKTATHEIMELRALKKLFPDDFPEGKASS